MPGQICPIRPLPYPVNNMTEWWYYNGKLVAHNGKKFGYYFVIFRTQFHFLWKKIIIGLAQYQITDVSEHKVVAYGSVPFSEKNSQFSTEKLDVSLGKQFLINKIGNEYHLYANTEKNHLPFSFNLYLKPLRKPLLVGGNGLIPITKNTNSYYYSITRLATHGNMTVLRKSYQLDNKSSLSWMDHQWGDFKLSSRTQWVWMSVQLNNKLDINMVKGVDPHTHKVVAGLATILLPND